MVPAGGEDEERSVPLLEKFVSEVQEEEEMPDESVA